MPPGLNYEASARAIQRFRSHEIRGLPRHILRFGPLTPASEEPSTSASESSTAQLPNPFLPYKNPSSGKWLPPKYSLRRQAELVKKAKAAGMVDMLPPGRKLFRPDLLAAEMKAKASLTLALTSAAKEASGRNQKAKADSVLSGVSNAVRKEINAGLEISVSWVGAPVMKEVAGTDLGIRLYAGKKRMFKGHKWERMKEGREKKMRILMRDMKKRVNIYKSHYRKKRPDPLKPLKSVKGKLPF